MLYIHMASSELKVRRVSVLRTRWCRTRLVQCKSHIPCSTIYDGVGWERKCRRCQFSDVMSWSGLTTKAWRGVACWHV